MKNSPLNLNKDVEDFANKISIIIEDNLSDNIEIGAIKKSNGKQRDGLECCKKGSFIYFLFNELDEVIYIGESGQTIKSRLFNDGNGSHYTKEWFSEVRYVKYYNDKSMDKNTRKLIERALIMVYSKKYNLYNKDK